MSDLRKETLEIISELQDVIDQAYPTAGYFNANNELSFKLNNLGRLALGLGLSSAELQELLQAVACAEDRGHDDPALYTAKAKLRGALQEADS